MKISVILKKPLLNLIFWAANAWFLIAAHIFLTGGFYGWKAGAVAYYPQKIAFPSFFLSVLVFLNFVFNPAEFPRLWVMRIFKKIASIPPPAALKIFFALFFLLFSAICLFRHYSFGSDAYDLGLFSTAVWNGGHGGGLFSSLKGNIDLLSDHFEPVLYLFSPVFYLWPDPAALLVTQNLLILSAIFPIYWIAREKLGSHEVALALVVSFLLSRTLKGIYVTDFYPECLLVPIFSFGMYFILKGRKLLFCILMILALGCKEDLAFSVAFMGIFLFFVRKERKLGVFLFVLGIASWIVTTKWVIPHFSATGTYRYVGRFPFGASYWDNLKAVLFSPWRLIPVLFTPPKLAYLLETFSPVGFLPILGLPYFIPAIPGILINLISNYWKQASVSFHYGSRILPFTYIAAIWGIDLFARRILPKIRPRWDRQKFLSFTAVALVLWAGVFISVPDTRQLSKFAVKWDVQFFEKRAILRKIPRDASLCASYFLVPHVSLRRYIYSWENTIGGKDTHTVCEYVALDKKVSGWTDSDFEGITQKLLKAGYQKIEQDSRNELFIFRNPAADLERVRLLSGEPV